MTKKKHWSVILLMVVGMIFVTVAGSIFVSSTWKLMSELAKEITLGIVTVGLFAGSHVARKNDKMKVTGRALYYLSIVSLGFLTYMSLNVLHDMLSLASWRVNLIRFGIADLLMMAAMLHIYFRKKCVFDFCMLYMMLNSLLLSILVGFEIGIHGITGVFAIETVFIAVIDSVIYKMNIYEPKNATRICSSVIYVIQMVLTSINAFVAAEANEGIFGYISVLWLLMFVSTLIIFVVRKDTFSRTMSNVWLAGLLCEVLYDIVCNFSVIPGYYLPEVLCMVFGVTLVFARILWYDVEEAKTTLNVITYTAACIMYPILLGHNLVEEHLACVLTLGISAFIILIWSAIAGSKKYMILSGIVLIIMAIYLTRAFWLSIAWWVYLMIAGIVCITLAIVKEKKTVAIGE